ncbi:MAG: thioredoxin [Spirochaetia bacterium]|nr:thioredoxin [Spirochaetia bacterium]
MALIDEATAKQLKDRFMAEMKNTVDVKVFTNPVISPDRPDMAELNEFTLSLGRELHAIEPRIIIQELNFNSPIAAQMGLQTSPSILIGYDTGYRIVYNGAPYGHEATAFLETLIAVSRGDAGPGGKAGKALLSLDKPVKIQVFVTPSCPYCPKSVFTANRIAIAARGKVTAECVESTENEALARSFNVSSVPQQVINGDRESITVGAQPENVLVMQVLKYGSPAVFETLRKEEEDASAKAEQLTENPDGIIRLTAGNFDAALAKYPALVVDFWAEWCGPCKMLGPVIEEMAQELKGKAVFGKLNIDENQSIAARYGIMSIPTVYYFKAGQKAGETAGALPKAELMKSLRGFLGI